MALTDALSVACKALGVAADVYWQSDKSKYTSDTQPEQERADGTQILEFYRLSSQKGYTKEIMDEWARKNMGGTPESLSKKQLERLLAAVRKWPDVT